MRRAIICLGILAPLLVASSLPSVQSSAVLRRADSTTVILLGTGMPRPDPSSSGPATVVTYGSRVFLFDAGPGVMRRISEAKLPVNGVTALFVTHLHSDHTLGYPDLIFTTWVMGRKSPMAAYGPHGFKKMTDDITSAWSEDIDIRTNGLEHDAAGGWKVNVHEIAPGVVYDSGGVKVTAIPVLHGSWKEAYGYRIDTPDRSIVISGDTRPSAALTEAAKGVDILIHEVYPANHLAPENRPGGQDWPTYMKSFHTSDVELGKIAATAKPKLLILYHVVRMTATDAELLKGVRDGGFTGRTVVGKDLQRY